MYTYEVHGYSKSMGGAYLLGYIQAHSQAEAKRAALSRWGDRVYTVRPI
jgi:hypothetical protein